MHTEVRVRSNIDALSERRLHEALVDMIKDAIVRSAAFLRADRAGHTRSGLTEKHINEEKVKDLAEVIEGRLGITAVVEKDARPTYGSFRHSQAPLFVDGGTRSPIFAARAGGVMTNRSEGIFARKSVHGQPAQHFMAKTFAVAQQLLRDDKHIAFALKEMAAEAQAMRAAMDI